MLRISKISFPGLGISEFSVNSVAFTVFGIDIAWYALIITFGIIACFFYVVYISKNIGLTSDDVLDLLLWAVPSGVIGARLYYVIFYDPSAFLSIKELFNIRGGGLAIYGAIILGALGVYIACRIKKIKYFAVGDCIVPGVLLAQGIGRWGNFMNGEAFGYETGSWIRMGLNNNLTGYATMYVHPTFLYESLWNIAGFILITAFWKKRKYDGQIVLETFAWYGFGRFFIEGMRTDSLMLGSLRISQVVGIVAFLLCGAALIFFLVTKKEGKLFFKQKKEKKTGAD